MRARTFRDLSAHTYFREMIVAAVTMRFAKDPTSENKFA
jgi:hypothetical protein